MKLLLLADINSSHTQKWVRSLSKNGVEVAVFTLSTHTGNMRKEHDVGVYSMGIDSQEIKRETGSLTKLKYVQALPKLKRIINEVKPDILHAHYASSYGILGALTGFHPYIVSVWGADVFDFPNKSFLHKKLLEFSLRKADKVLSTSHVMAKETKKYTNKKIEITPFGIALEQFRPMKGTTLFNENDIVIGTVKSLEDKYGIDCLIGAFKSLVEEYPRLPLKLLIVGGGSRASALKQLAIDYSINHRVIFTGYVDHGDIPMYHNMLSVFAALSIADSESFGVAVIEASACEKPVVVSNVGGLPEVVEDGVTGIVVPPRNIKKAAEALKKLIFNEELRSVMGKAGRERVKNLYDWHENVSQMMNIYRRTILQ